VISVQLQRKRRQVCHVASDYETANPTIGWFNGLPVIVPSDGTPSANTCPVASPIQYPPPVALAAIPTTVEAACPVAEPWNGASKEKIPPVDDTNQYPPVAESVVMPTNGSVKGLPPIGIQFIKMDIHLFDGQLKNHQLDSLFSNVQKYSDVQRHCIMNTFYNSMIPHMSREQNHVLQLIIKDDRKASNYDGTNNLHADDLLILITEKIPFTVDFAKLFSQILEEIRTGLCPQGRAIRLYQLYISH